MDPKIVSDCVVDADDHAGGTWIPNSDYNQPVCERHRATFDPDGQHKWLKPSSFAGCYRCHTPLIATFEVDFKEWYCPSCDRFYEYLKARPVEWTVKRQTQYNTDHEAYDMARKQRQLRKDQNEHTSSTQHE